MGIAAGTATATTTVHEGGGSDGNAATTSEPTYDVAMRTRSAAWLAPLYPIADTLTTQWSPAAGPVSGETHFREGRFQQDNVIVFADPITVARRQFIDDRWQERSLSVASAGRLEDAIGALWRLREASTPDDVSFPVFTGSKVLPLHAACQVEAALRRCDVVVGAAPTDASTDLHNTVTAWFSTDAARLPVRARLETRAGAVSVTLVDSPVR